MKKNLTISLLVLFAFAAANLSMAQSPEKFKYQAVLRDASGNIIANTAVSVVIDILQGSGSGTSVYQETQGVTTTAQGVINLDLGGGTVNSGVFATINWSKYNFWVKVTLGGTVISTGQLLSTPYSLKVKGVELDPSTGNIGIGTTSPASILHLKNTTGAALTVESSNASTGPSVNLNNTGTGGKTWQLLSTGTSSSSGVAGNFELWQPLGTALTVKGTNNYIGIGTVTPDFRLTVAGVIRSTNNSSECFRVGDDAGLWDINVGSMMGLYSSSDNSVGGIKLGSGGEYLYGRGGNIGIGTTTPGFKLDVNGTARINSWLEVAGNVYTYGGVFEARNNSADWAELRLPGNQFASNMRRAIGNYPSSWGNWLTLNPWNDFNNGTRVNNYFYAASNMDVASTLGVYGGNLYLKGSGGDVNYRLGNNSFDKRSMSYCSGWVSNALYLNAFNDWGDGVYIGSDSYNSQLHVKGYVNFNGNLDIGGKGCSSGGFLICSDARLKTNVESMTNSLEKVLKMRGVTYLLKKDTSASFGFIAQELEQVYPLAVYTAPDGFKAVNYSPLVAVMAEAIKELNTKVEKLEQENAQLRSETSDISTLKAEVEELKTLMKAGKLLGSK